MLSAARGRISSLLSVALGHSLADLLDAPGTDDLFASTADDEDGTWLEQYGLDQLGGFDGQA